MQMIPSFPGFPENSRVWIFQADARIDTNAADMIRKAMEDFLSEWTSHDKKMQAVQTIFLEHFLVVALNEEAAGASGCGIDKLMRAVQNAGHACGIHFFDRTRIVTWLDNKAQLISLDDVPVLVQADTPVFEFHHIQSLSDLKQFCVPAAQSWIGNRIKARA